MSLLQEARQKNSELAESIARVEQELKNAPTGTLRISKSHKSIQYYKVDRQNKRVYILKKHRGEAQKLAQRDYLKKLLTCLKKNLRATNYLIKKYNPESLYKCFSTLLQLPDTKTSNLYGRWQLRSRRRNIDTPATRPSASSALEEHSTDSTPRRRES